MCLRPRPLRRERTSSTMFEVASADKFDRTSLSRRSFGGPSFLSSLDRILTTVSSMRR